MAIAVSLNTSAVLHNPQNVHSTKKLMELAIVIHLSTIVKFLITLIFVNMIHFYLHLKNCIKHLMPRILVNVLTKLRLLKKVIIILVKDLDAIQPDVIIMIFISL